MTFKFLEDYEKLSKKIESEDKQNLEDLKGSRNEQTLETIFRKKTGKSFSHFYHIYYVKLTWYLQNKLHDNALAKDMAGDAFMKALSKIESYDEKYQFSTWLFNIANNMAKDHLKEQNKHQTLSIDSNNEDGQNILSTLEDKNDSSDIEYQKVLMKYNIMKNCISNLSPKYKEVIELREYKKMSYQEISNKLGINESTLKSRIRQGRLNLIEAVTEQYKLIEKMY